VFGKPIETHLLARISRGSVLVLALFLALRLRDLQVRGALSYVLRFDNEAWMFLAEIGLGVVLPMLLLAWPFYRREPRRLAVAQGLVVLGFIFHRLNVSTTAIVAMTGVNYVPAAAEFIVSMGLVAVGMMLFVLACRFLPVFPEGALVDVERAEALEKEIRSSAARVPALERL